MHLSPRETEKLLLFLAGELAEKRKARGLKLNYPEAIALISSRLQEAARDGQTVAELMQLGTTFLTREDVMEGIPEMIHDIQSCELFVATVEINSLRCSAPKYY